MKKILVETSARHIHVTQEALEILCGKGATLEVKAMLSQPGQFCSTTKLNLVGPKNAINGVSISNLSDGYFRVTFDLSDCYAEKKVLSDGSESIVIYFVQKEDKKLPQEEICLSMDAFIGKQGVTIDGYKEYDVAITTSPTTLKPETRVLNGYVKYYENGDAEDVCYTLTDIDDVLDIQRKPKEKALQRKR